MADISMTYSGLSSAASKINTAKTNLDSVISSLEQAVAALDADWFGESYQAFVSAWQESKPTMQKLSEAIGEFSPALEKVVANQQETEAANAATMGGLGF